MTLVVETGAIVAGADSYISLSAARTYAASRGISISGVDATAEVQLRKGFDYIEARRLRYQGVKANAGQVTQWPRLYAYLDGEEIDSATIPAILQYAQVHVAAAIEAGLDVLPNAANDGFITRSKIGGTSGMVETVYSEQISTTGIPIIRKAEECLAPLYASTGLTAVRA